MSSCEEFGIKALTHQANNRLFVKVGLLVSVCHPGAVCPAMLVLVGLFLAEHASATVGPLVNEITLICSLARHTRREKK